MIIPFAHSGWAPDLLTLTTLAPVPARILHTRLPTNPFPPKTTTLAFAGAGPSAIRTSVGTAEDQARQLPDKRFSRSRAGLVKRERGCSRWNSCARPACSPADHTTQAMRRCGQARVEGSRGCHEREDSHEPRDHFARSVVSYTARGSHEKRPPVFFFDALFVGRSSF